METEHDYKAVSLGRPAVFYLPSDLMGIEVELGTSCRKMVTEFLEREYGGYTDEGNNHNGFWRNDSGQTFSDKYQKYRVSFKGPERIPKLQRFLAYIAVALNQESIYLETGEDTWLIYPEKNKE